MRRLGSLLLSRSWMRVFDLRFRTLHQRQNTLIRLCLIACAIRRRILLPHGRRNTLEPLPLPFNAKAAQNSLSYIALFMIVDHL